MPTDEDLGLAPAPDQAAPAAPATAPAPDSEGRTITVRPRPAPKPPPAPIAPHPSVPLAAAPAALPPDAEGQKPPTDEDLGIVPRSSAAGDIGKSALSGAAEGTEGLLGTAKDIPKLADYGLDWAEAHMAQALGQGDAQEIMQRTHGSAMRGMLGDKAFDALSSFAPLSYMPGAADIQGAVNKVFPSLGYKPQTGPGRYAHEIAAFAPGALIPGGGEAGIVSRLAGTVAPAIGSETLGHMAQGTQYEPWARLIGAGLGGLTQAGLQNYAAPMTKAGQEDIAATQLRDNTSEPDAALAKLRATQAQTPPGMTTGENVPGSKPTTAQITGDYGQVAAERAYQSGPGQAVHGQRMAEQSAAQTGAARGVQPSGNPQTISDMITKRLSDIDAEHELEMGVRQKAHDLGTQRLTEEAQAATGKVAKLGEPEALGGGARRAMADSMARAKAKETRLWEAIDKNKIGVWANAVKARARNVAANLGVQKPMSGEEKAIFDAASALPRWTKLRDVMDLTSRLKAEMRNERFTNGNSPALKRMAQLNKTLENTIANNASRASAKEAQEEMDGLRRMTPEDRAKMMEARSATRERGQIERSPVGPVIRKGQTSEEYRTMASQVPGKVFSAGPTGYQKAKAFADATGKPWIDPFNDIVADSLAREATTDGMIDPAKLTKWQGKYRDALRALPDDVRQRYVKGPGEAGEALAEGAAQRRRALIEHSKLDIAKQMGKESPQAQAMRSNPAFKGFEGVDNPRDVQKVVGGVLQRPDAVTRLGQLRQHVAGTPAEEGLKRAVLDHILEKTLSTAEAGTTGEKMLQPGGFQKTIANNRVALKAAGFSEEQLATLDKISGDLQRQQRFNATKVRAGSDTAQNQFASLKKIAEGAGHNAGWLAPLLAFKEIYERLPEALHGVAGIGAAGVAYGTHKVLSAARHSGLEKAQDLYHEAIMHPDTAEHLLSRSSPGSHARLSRALKRGALYGGLAAERTTALH
jgi:hypothetical protein